MIAEVTHRNSVSFIPQDLAGFACQNPLCPVYGKKGLGNLRVDSYYGKARALRLLFCRSCRSRFSERKGSRLFGSQLATDLVARLYECLDQGRGIRETARLLAINRNTVARYRRRRQGRQQKSHGEQ
jgi:LacI family transcriptional regulator